MFLIFLQTQNIFKSVDKNIALKLLWSDLTENGLYEAITELLKNPIYKENAVKASVAFRDQKESPLERAIWWIEWALRNPNPKYFNGSGKEMNYLQLQSIDVVSFLIGIILIVLWLVKMVLIKVYKMATKVTSKGKRKNE